MNTLFEISPNRKDEWLTPPQIVKSLGPFDLDPCSPINRPWPTAHTHYTVEDNGLTKSWFGRVWCNPPYSNIGVWLKKCAYHNNAIALLFARTDTKDFFAQVWNKADSVFFLAGRLKFYHSSGIIAGNAGAPSVLVSYGEQNTQAIEKSGLSGKHVRLKATTIIVVGVSPTWYSVITIAVNNLGELQLKPLYDMVERIAPDKVAINKNWKAKVRQQVQEYRRKNIIKTT